MQGERPGRQTAVRLVAICAGKSAAGGLGQAGCFDDSVSEVVYICTKPGVT
jgi:hypothetical protein